ncbi:ATP-binding protein [Mycoplasmopsis meleagridis]|uniref:ATP-binding protein n=1 Tax=Mycoplasmopsis meleagridis TaxID=29561 RepID=UPI00073D869C|nr:ATP-binding protein [Mycoplasmopsis meleagridis]KUH47647.1 hypothetical protein ASB56_00745 [Mycoplasmopsis meleagridis]
MKVQEYSLFSKNIEEILSGDIKQKFVSNIKNHPDLLKLDLFKQLKIEDDEILEYGDDFIELIESLKNSANFPYKFKITRKKNGELVFRKKIRSNKEFVNLYLKSLNLFCSDISNLDFSKSLKNVISHTKITNATKNIILDKINLFFVNNKSDIELKNNFILYSSNIKDVSYFVQAIANNFIGENKTVAYLKCDELQKFINYLVSEKISSLNLLNKLIEVEILVLDDIASIKPKNYFINDNLFFVLREREKNKKITIISTDVSTKDLFTFWNDNIEKNNLIFKKLFTSFLEKSEVIKIT